MMDMKRKETNQVKRISTALLVMIGLATLVGGAASIEFGSWSRAVNVQSIPGTDPDFNTAFNDGCPALAHDDRTIFMASNRPGGMGGQDIWVATRESKDAPWGAPVNVGAPINSTADDFCPSPARNGHLFFFVSTRGGCGGSDIYVTRWRNDNQGWEEPVNLGCEVNSVGNEASPFLIQERATGPVLYFSSNRAGGYTAEAPGVLVGDDDLYVSEFHGGAFGPADLVPFVNS
jgi:hypothetical protein